MPPKRSKHSKKKRSLKARQEYPVMGIIITGLALLLIGGFIAAYLQAKGNAEKIDKTSSCRTNDLPEITAVVIDHTDRITPVQKLSLENRLWDVANSVEKNGAIRFYSVEDIHERALDADFELCNPGSEKDVNEWSGNKRQAKKRFDEKFGSVVKSNLDAILTSNVSKDSPIMAATQSAIVTSFIGEKNNAKKKRLVLVSDLLEYTKDFSLYELIPDFEDFRQTAHWKSVKSDMKGVDVEIYFLNRPGNAQTPRLKVFWQMYFLEQGASSVKFLPIEG